MIKVIQLRLVAETEGDALAAIEMLINGVGSARIAIASPHEGRKGGWLAYGTVQVDEQESQYATGRAITDPDEEYWREIDGMKGN